MSVWVFRSGFSNSFSAMTFVDIEDMDLCIINGKELHWGKVIQFEPIIEKKKKNQQPFGDINGVMPASVILNPKAYHALKDFLSPFGQLLPVECFNRAGLLGTEVDSETHYFYNVTNIIPCIDYQHSEKKIGTSVSKPVFFADKIPQDIQVFKDPYRVRADIYLSEAAKLLLEKLIAEAGLSGAEIIPAC
ncbi:MAG: hypothetical protein HYZ45_02785 [Burkholderiales bacterium]|nr:hypothetical protein [Burkholderiales bacterium]